MNMGYFADKDYYEQAKQQLINHFDMIDLRKGDCLELMKDLPDKSIDAIIADLPYGTTVVSGIVFCLLINCGSNTKGL